MKYYIYIIAFSLILCALSCKKCNEMQVVDSIGSEMYSYVFRDTSTWIYRNTSTNAFDTVIEYNMQHSQQNEDTSAKCIQLSKEFFQLDFNSKIDGGNIYYFDYHGIRLNGNGGISSLGQMVYDRSLLNIGDSSPYLKYVAFYPSINIQGNVINNVVEFETIFHSTYIPNTTYYYWAPGFFIVRKQIQDSLNNITTWDLYKSNLIYL